MPVSYTHLDVYKRQVYNRVNARPGKSHHYLFVGEHIYKVLKTYKFHAVHLCQICHIREGQNYREDERDTGKYKEQY